MNHSDRTDGPADKGLDESSPKRVIIVDDDPAALKLETRLLEDSGWEVKSFCEPEVAREAISREIPDVVLLDLMMPGVDGMAFLSELRNIPALNRTRMIVVTAKSFAADVDKAFENGADGYVIKPFTPEKMLKELEGADDFEVTFWGIRGTLPRPGNLSIKYGGNTSCVSVRLSKERLFIFDAGSGIKELSDHIMATRKGKFKANLMISHPHWDHINAFPFFVPLYIPGNEISLYGPSQGAAHSLRKIMADQMDGTYFPVTLNEFSAKVSYDDLVQGSCVIDGVKVRTMLLSHPGNCLGYRIDHGGRCFCYITDNELFPEDSQYYSEDFRQRLINFISGADILVHDTTYFDEEYPKKVLWGHSCVGLVAKLAHDADVKRWYLFHHDPDHSDADVERKCFEAHKILRSLGSDTKCFIAREKSTVTP